MVGREREREREREKVGEWKRHLWELSQSSRYLPEQNSIAKTGKHKPNAKKMESFLFFCSRPQKRNAKNIAQNAKRLGCNVILVISLFRPSRTLKKES